MDSRFQNIHNIDIEMSFVRLIDFRYIFYNHREKFRLSGAIVVIYRMTNIKLVRRFNLCLTDKLYVLWGKKLCGVFFSLGIYAIRDFRKNPNFYQHLGIVKKAIGYEKKLVDELSKLNGEDLIFYAGFEPIHRISKLES